MGDGRGGKAQRNDLFVAKPVFPELSKLGLLCSQLAGQGAHHQQQNGGGYGYGYQQPAYGQPPGGYGQPPSGYGQPPGGYAQPPLSYPLPPAASEWQTATSPDGETYYYSSKTGETSWDKPPGVPSRRPSELPEY